MTVTDRRYTRYLVNEGTLKTQHIKQLGIFGLLGGWGECKVRDLSLAGALVLTKRKLGVGDRVELKLVGRDGVEMRFQCAVANASTDHKFGGFKLGVCITEPAHGSLEHQFLTALPNLFPAAP